MTIHPIAWHLLQEAQTAFWNIFGEKPPLSRLAAYAVNLLHLYTQRHPQEIPQPPQWTIQPIPHSPRIPINGTTVTQLNKIAEELNLSPISTFTIATYLLYTILNQLNQNI